MQLHSIHPLEDYDISIIQEVRAQGLSHGWIHPTLRPHCRHRAIPDASHLSALAHGGRDSGMAGERAGHPRECPAGVLHPDGNNVEAVQHGAAARSVVGIDHLRATR